MVFGAVCLLEQEFVLGEKNLNHHAELVSKESNESHANI
jgi:hypothetical protein